MNKQSVNVSDRELQDMLKKFDRDGDGHLNYREFVAMMMDK